MKKDLKFLTNLKTTLCGGMLLPLLLASCGSKENRTLVVVDEPLPSDVKGYALPARDVDGGKLYVVCYDKDGLCSYLKPHDTLNIKLLNVRFNDHSAVHSYERGADLYITDYQNPHACGAYTETRCGYEYNKDKFRQWCLRVDLSEDTKNMLLDRSAKDTQGVFHVNGCLRNTNDSLKIANTILTKLASKTSGDRASYINEIQTNGTQTEKTILNKILKSVKFVNNQTGVDAGSSKQLGKHWSDNKHNNLDTLTVIRVYTESRSTVDNSTDRHYSSASEEKGVHLKAAGKGKVGIGKSSAYVSGNETKSEENGVHVGAEAKGKLGIGKSASQFSSDEKSTTKMYNGKIVSVVAKDKNGKTYNFSLTPEMNCKVGDKIVLEYFGRIAGNNGYRDQILIHDIIYKTR